MTITSIETSGSPQEPCSLIHWDLKMRATESELIRQVDKLKEENKVLHLLIASLRGGMREILEVVSEDHDAAASNLNDNDDMINDINNINNIINSINNINLARVSDEVKPSPGRGLGQSWVPVTDSRGPTRLSALAEPYVPVTDARSIPPEYTSKEPPVIVGGGGGGRGGGGGEEGSDWRWLPCVLDELRAVDRSLIELKDRLERARLGSEKR